MLGALIEKDSIENLDKDKVGDFLLIPPFSFNFEDKDYWILQYYQYMNYTFHYSV